jgi:hypothetical protein
MLVRARDSFIVRENKGWWVTRKKGWEEEKWRGPLSLSKSKRGKAGRGHGERDMNVACLLASGTLAPIVTALCVILLGLWQRSLLRATWDDIRVTSRWKPKRHSASSSSPSPSQRSKINTSHVGVLVIGVAKRQQSLNLVLYVDFSLHWSCLITMSDPAPPASLAAKAVLTLGSVVFFHAAYSTYEFLGLQTSLGLTGKSVPMDIKIETLVSLFVIFLGTLLTASPLRDITWASEYKKRWVKMLAILTSNSDGSWYGASGN